VAQNSTLDFPARKITDGSESEEAFFVQQVGNMRRLTIAGLIAALTLGSFVPVASAKEPDKAPWWPSIKGKPVVTEWYSDIPWHQKLGTFAGNEIDEAIVFPYEALETAEKAFCTNKNLSPEECMLETGITNILGTYRTDTLYDLTDPKIGAAQECQNSQPCIQVKLELSSFFTGPKGADIDLQRRPFGTEPAKDPFGADYGGYVITDGSTYAPQMPWYMAHYCDSQFELTDYDVLDPVCYGDYLSTMNDGFNAVGLDATHWPKSVSWSVFPAATAKPNHCKSGETTCILVMGGFDLRPVPADLKDLQYTKYNKFLFDWFNHALKSFPNDFGQADLQRHFPWSGTEVTWNTFLYPQAKDNPFLGQFMSMETAPAEPPGCDVTLTGPTIPPKCPNTAIFRASTFLYPRQCTLADLTGTNIARLRNCGLNYELHHNGWLSQWPKSFWNILQDEDVLAPNQYGRTSFLFAGVPGMQLPVPFDKDPVSGLSVYERVYNASIFSLYLPIANEADVKNAFHGRNYTDTEFYHTLLMSNHMESDPWEFANGIRGKVLWHDEYRTQKMYDAYLNKGSRQFGTRTFAAAFDPLTAPAPFHNSSCDGCHVRNGSGIPINTASKLDVALQEFMSGAEYNPYPVKDYTFTGKIQPMKLVFFDLKRVTSRLDDSVYSKPLAFSAGLVAQPSLYYNNKIMNFYGDSFHVTMPGYNYVWNYKKADPNRMVVNTPRVNSELNKTYEPLQVELGAFQTPSSCQGLFVLPPPTSKPWPKDCNDINNVAIHGEIDGGAVGFMLLNGKRLGNLSAIEAIPNAAIFDFQRSQSIALGPTIAGEILWNAGSRGGVDGEVHKACQTKGLTDCYIGRFGWLGDRVSLEDQVANAAFVEMNMTTSEGYKKLYPDGKVMFPIRYAYPDCGPANKTCVESKGNADLSERDVDRMADYARWLGNPTRSDFTVSLPEVIAGEKIFKQLRCDTCHVTRKIEIDDPNDTMLSKDFRDRLATRVAQSAPLPFLSYIGTDLLMHDMGYLSQVGNASHSIRDQDGVVLARFADYVQKIRTPALKGLRFNRFVTESHKNTKKPLDPACDFLLHDGRACDAIEAAFLHDGPAIKKLGVVEGLNGLTPSQILELRAFLYSL
jgi:CxxC motif-containing protein (DUF1111 family)